MRKSYVALALLVATALIWGITADAPRGAAATVVHYYDDIGSVTVDSEFYGTTVWNLIDSQVVVGDDTATVVFKVSGVAVMDPGDRLYIGFGQHTAGVGLPNLDTVMVQPKNYRQPRQRVPFSITFQECDTLAGTGRDHLMWTGGATDTCYILAACGGSGQTESVLLEDVMTEFIVIDNNSCDGTAAQ